MIEPSASNLVYIKLGGSLITDKRQAETPRLDVIQRLAAEIAAARRGDPSMRLIIGHGSGSFGHVVGSRYGTRNGVRTSEQWYGFAATADAAARLNRIVTAALLAAGIPAWSIPPGVALRCEDGVIVDGPAETVRLALDRGLVPLVHGDVALDRVRGGTIASTEEIFEWLAERLPPQRMVLAGEVDGVYTGDPLRDPSAQRIPEITPHTFADMATGISHSFGTDVTGGMAAKVQQALRLCQRHPQLRILLCSGLIPGAVQRALTEEGGPLGTVIYS
ncbi:MAG: isopentenyl phosphate kinase family protein [Caldilineaceae bacterium]|nr:isopentenyl phosphate kinase family protein [Caldilineaceae bacterium]